MLPATEQILAKLDVVDGERRARAADPGLTERVQCVKAFQQQRFADTYADLLATPRYADASRFFLDELYGPKDFTQRDAQFARVVPALVRLFPDDIVDTVRTLAELHALSEVLDTAMARHVGNDALDLARYRAAWRQVGHPVERSRQIELTLAVGQALDRLVRHGPVRQALRMMRLPARAAGLGALQAFLECGFDTFKAMHGASDFLATIEQRERAFAAAMFAEGA